MTTPVGAEAVALEALAEPLEEVFAGPPDTFTAARNALAAKLRELGRRDEAASVKALRKPSLAVWAVNQLARRRAEEVEALLDLSARLRESQLAALSGERPHADFAAASRARRDLIAKLVGQAAEILAGEGVAGAKGHQDKIAATLLAAGDDDATAAAVRRGLLTAELSPGGFGAAWGAAPPPDVPAVQEEPRRADEARAEADRLAEQARAAEAAAEELERRAAAAERAAAAAREEAERARGIAREAGRTARDARAAADRLG